MSRGYRPCCHDCRSYGTYGRKEMNRVYIRESKPGGKYKFVPIGWYCSSCGKFEKDGSSDNQHDH